MLCKKLRPKPSFLSAPLWQIIRLRIDRNTSPETHFFSTEAPESTDEDGKGLLCSLENPKSAVGSSTSEKVEQTKTLLRKYGFTNTQLSKMYAEQPRVFTSVPEETLVLKLDFFRGIGFSNTDLPRFICSNTALLGSSLQNKIVPSFNFIKALLLSDSDEDVMKIIKRCPRLITDSAEKRIAPNIAALREAGVPPNRISYLLRCLPSTLGLLSLGESIRKATDMGFDPNKLSFVDAVRVFSGLSKSTCDKKMEVLRKCGMTDAQILMAFRSKPMLMSLAEQNIVQTMDFVVKKMGWQPVNVAKNPTVLDLSLEKRIIPRCTVVRYLQGKGLLRRSISVGSFLTRNEKVFLDKFVKKYEDAVPELMDIYSGKTSPQEPILPTSVPSFMEKR